MWLISAEFCITVSHPVPVHVLAAAIELNYLHGKDLSLPHKCYVIFTLSLIFLTFSKYWKTLHSQPPSPALQNLRFTSDRTGLSILNSI